MRILFLTYQGDVAGSTNSISYLAKGLVERGHQVFLGCRKESLLYKLVENTKITRIPMTFNSKVDFANMRQIRDVVKQYDIQIINAQSSKDRYTSIFARWIFGLNYKLLHTRRQVSQSVGGLQSILYNVGTDKIVAVSHGVKESLISNGIKDKNIAVIHNGTPTEKYHNIDKEEVQKLRDKFDISQNDFVIGCIAREKKQAQLLEALQYLDFKVTLILVGMEEPSYFQELQKNYQLEHQVHFVGNVSNQVSLQFYKLLNVKVLPSVSEGLSQSILEAMFLKVPVIATNEAGNKDIVYHEKTGLLFEDEDIRTLAGNIAKIKNDSALKNKLVENAYKMATDTFSINQTIINYENLFSQVIG